MASFFEDVVAGVYAESVCGGRATLRRRGMMDAMFVCVRDEATRHATRHATHHTPHATAAV
jgi:hypothetical protein